jgi:hypothetical protein
VSGRRIRLRAECEARYPRLFQFFACYLHQDWPVFHGSVDGAIDDAIAENPRALLGQIRAELGALLAATPDDTRLRAVLNDGIGVNVSFRKATAARAFAESVEQRLLSALGNRPAAIPSKPPL